MWSLADPDSDEYYEELIFEKDLNAKNGQWDYVDAEIEGINHELAD